jgi:hypothetical protein
MSEDDLSANFEDELYLYEAYREGMHRLHSSEYLLDLKNGLYHAFSVSDTTPGFWASDGCISDAVPVFLSKFPKDDGYKELVEKHLNPEWLKQCLADNRLEEIDYCRRIGGRDRWFRMSFAAVAHNEDQEVRFVMVATTEITDIIGQREKMQKEFAATDRRLKREMSIVSAFKNIYFISFYINVQTEEFQIIEAPKEFFDLISGNTYGLRQTVELLAQTMVSPEYADGFVKFLEPKDIEKRLDQSNLVQYDYFTKNGKWCRCSLIVCTRNAGERIENLICAVQDITSEKINSRN